MHSNTSKTYTTIRQVSGLVKLSVGTGIKLKVANELKSETRRDVSVASTNTTYQCDTSNSIEAFADGKYKAVGTSVDPSLILEIPNQLKIRGLTLDIRGPTLQTPGPTL